MRSSVVRRSFFSLVGLFSASFFVFEPCIGRADDAELADPNRREVYVAVDSLPVFSSEGLTEVRLSRGRRVTIVDVAQLETGGDFVGIEWIENDKKLSGTVAFRGVSKAKLDPAAAVPKEKTPSEATEKPSTSADRKRLEGTWMIAGMTVLGRTNPSPNELVAAADAPSPFPAGMPQPKGQIPPRMPAGMMTMYIPASKLYRFHDGQLTRWGLNFTIDDKKQVVWQPQHYGELGLMVDALAAPRQLDTFDPRLPATMRRSTTGIYRWEAGDVLVWATHTAMGKGLMPSIGPTNGARLAGFKPEQLKKATVLYLIRVDEKRYPMPDAPKLPAQEQGGNFF